ncbi:MAG: DUF5667 domain-containing protein [Anaerolineales bacterium]|nr:DUF5667 domain-containing protein [Anaerolineales bacterium]
MNTIGKDPQESIIERLRRLRRIPPRDIERAAQGRAAFLAQARQIKNQTSFRPPVSDGNKLRLIGWIYTLPDFFVRKEQYPMFHRLIAVFIALAVVFGGATATAFAAQNSLPADALYPLKTLTEDFRYNLSAQMESRLELALNYAARRVGEISALSELGLPTPAQTATRLGEQIEAALNIAAGLEGSAQQQAFARITTHLQQHERTLAQLSELRPEDPVLLQAHMMLQEQLHLAEQGLSDPQGVQQQLQTRAQTRPWVIQESPQGGGSPIDNANSNSNDNGNANGNANDDNSNGNDNDGNDNDDDDNGNANGNDNGDDDDNGNANGNDNGDDNGNDNGDDDDNGNANGNDNGDDDDNGNGNDNGDDDDNGNANGNDNGDDNGNDRGGNDNDDDDKSGNGNGDDRSGGDRAPTLTLIGLILNLAAQIF